MNDNVMSRNIDTLNLKKNLLYDFYLYLYQYIIIQVL